MKRFDFFDIDKQKRSYVMSCDIIKIKAVIEYELEIGDKSFKTSESIKTKIELKDGSIRNCIIENPRMYYHLISYLKIHTLIIDHNGYVSHLENWKDMPTRAWRVYTEYFKVAKGNKFPCTWQEVADSIPYLEFRKLKNIGDATCNDLNTFFKNHGVTWRLL